MSDGTEVDNPNIAIFSSRSVLEKRQYPIDKQKWTNMATDYCKLPPVMTRT